MLARWIVTAGATLMGHGLRLYRNARKGSFAGAAIFAFAPLDGLRVSPVGENIMDRDEPVSESLTYTTFRDGFKRSNTGS